MVFVTGNSFYVQPSLSYPLSLSSSSRSVLFYSFPRNAEAKRSTVAMASTREEEDESSIEGKMSCQRRAFLFVAISVIPFFKLTARALDPPLLAIRKRARALDGFPTTKAEPKVSEENQKAEDPQPRTTALEVLPTKESEVKPSEESQNAEELQKEAPSNGFVSLLSSLGIFGSGVLGALYALAQKEKAESDATIESMKAKVKEKEAAIVSLENNFQSKLLSEQEERTKQLGKAKEEQLSLLNKLNSANSTIAGLGQEIKSEKRLIEQRKVQINSLEIELSKAAADKKTLEQNLKENLDLIEVLEERINSLNLELKDREVNVQNLRSSLADKDLELQNLETANKQINDELANAGSEIQELKDELSKNQKEIELKNSVVEELNATVSSLSIEKDSFKGKLDNIQREYNDLKLASQKKAASDAEILGEKEEELHRLKENLEIAFGEACESQEVIAKLTQERENLREVLNAESNKVSNLNHELHIAQESLGKSRDEALDLENQLITSNRTCKELEAEVSRVQAEFAEVKATLQRSLDEAKSSGEVLASELNAVKEILKNTKEELQNVLSELAAVVENWDSLKRELVDVYKKAETAANDLKEEQKTVSTLNKEIQALEKQLVKDKEARKSLETDLEEATRSLDEMNRNALTLSRDLEQANFRISELEDEKQVLYQSLTEQKNLSREARENMEDAHDLVMRLGKERETLDKRAKKLEEELSSAKGEILRLRSQINSSKAAINNEKPQKAEAEGNVTASVKRVSRRRRTSSQ
ncbi:MAR-binding filament-like protein 1-1 isoform X3 [Morus notabilis]|uniref:MAR-binding filament-like protein 1-1 isoform X3 n=1 Tax=Morus notabilis TaxID=981085 RepID=UPI000CED6E16|nr:MAR-binding filament-like protein 1-1 isoform X3 [Morus notabilis]